MAVNIGAAECRPLPSDPPWYECPCRGTPGPPPVVPEDGALGVEETLPAAARRHAHQLAPVQQRREVHLAVAAHPAVKHAGGVFEG